MTRPRARSAATLVLAGLLSTSAACGDDDFPPDGGPPDTGAPDTGVDGGVDSGAPDAGPEDAGPPDSGIPDAGPPIRVDAGPVDCDEPVATWARVVLGTDNQQVLAAAADSTGGIVVTGRNQGQVDFGDGALDADVYHGVFVARIDDAGDTLWSVQFLDTGDDSEPKGLAVDGDDNVFVTGYVKGTVDFGLGPVAPTVGDGLREMFVLKLDAAGETQWVRRYGMGTMWSVAPAPGGDVVVAGSASGTNDFGDGEVRANGQGDIVVLRLDADGDPVRSALLGSDALDTAYGVAVNGDGEVAITGQVYGEIDFGGGLRGAERTNHFYVARLGADFSYRFDVVRRGDSAAGQAVAFTPDDGVLVQGDGRGMVNLGRGPLESFVAKLDASGRLVWNTEIEPVGFARSLGFGEDGEVWVVGRVDPTAWGCPAPAGGRRVVLTALLEADGAYRGSRSVVGQPALWSVDTAPGGVIVTAGWFSGSGLDMGTGPLANTLGNDVVAAGYTR